MHPAIAIGNYFYERAEQAGASLTGDKVQSLVYFAQGLRLALVNLPLLDEAVMANRDGISLPSISRLGIVGSRKLAQLLTELRTDPRGLIQEVAPVLAENDSALPTLELVWSRFGAFSAYDLGVFVRSADSPWDQTWNSPQHVEGRLETGGSQGWQADDRAIPIPNSLIRRWFRQLVIQENRDQAQADGLEQTVMVGRQRLERTADLSPLKKLRSL